jgi:hypothetical protein
MEIGSGRHILLMANAAADDASFGRDHAACAPAFPCGKI